jgi:DNA invertase Pin-like site-specific DNA recombinase
VTKRANLTTGREYLRVSFDKTGREKSNDEQHSDNLGGAAGLGIDSFGQPYRDTGSASKHARRKRDDFGHLLDDLARGRFGADVLVLWESSRGSRKVGEWVTLIESCEKAGVKIAVTTHSRCYDPANPRDRRSLLEDAVDSEYESAKISDRGRRTAASQAGKGLPHGRIPYGYRRIYDQNTRQLLRQEADPVEGPVVVEAFTRFAAGHSLAAICRDFVGRGIASRQGVPFSPQTLRGLLLAPVYRGQRVHSPGKRRSGVRHGPPEHTYDAAWPPLVSDDLFFAVQARLKDPARTTTRPGRAKHLVSMHARCHHCGGPLVATYRYGARRYQCQGAGHVTVDASELDTWAEAEILGVLTRPDVLERLMPQAVDPTALDAARDEVARVKAEHADLVAQVSAGKVSATLAAGSEPGILARLQAAEARVQEMTTPAGLRQLIDPGPKVVQRWKAMPMEAKREVVRILFSKGLLGVLAVARVNRGANTVKARVRLDGKPLPT